MTAVRKTLRRRRKPLGLVAGLVALTAVLVFAIGANTASLPGSNFEIDGAPSGSNFTVDLPDPPSLDWNNVDNSSQPDAPTGQNDDSYKGGVKEDTVCPEEVTGSIPNNKSDLKSYLVYQEPEADGPGFLNLGWIRVNDPSGTTLMDFELNHSSTPCAQGPNVVRTPGDLLIEYAITQGGAVANITAREWSGTAWGAANPLPGQAIGTINLVPIPANQTGGESAVPLAARTFGEMSLDLDFIFDDESCESFGSTQLKSRSSDAFNSQLKDFIRPIPVNISNCGQVIIRKETDPDGAPDLFNFDKVFPTIPASTGTFDLADGEFKDYPGVVVGTGYTVDEDLAELPAGWEFVNVDCSASSADTEFVITDENVTFDIAAGDVLDCTYNNRQQQGAILVTKTRKHAADGPGPHPHAGVDFTVNGETKTTNADGQVCFDGLSFASHDVTETLPAGYHADQALTQAVVVDNNATCGDDPYGGEEVAFGNTPLTNVTVSVDSQVDGGTASDIDCDGTTGSTGADGDGSVTVEDLEPTAPGVTLTCTITVDP